MSKRGLSALRKGVIIFLLFASILSDVGCRVERDSVEEPDHLTQRQEELLEEMGLPTEYDSLTDSQKNAITSIEDCLTYLEDKYHEEFRYLSYAKAGPLEEEHLEAYPASETPSDVVTVYRTYEDGEYHYEDDYNNQAGKLPLVTVCR